MTEGPGGSKAAELAQSLIEGILRKGSAEMAAAVEDACHAHPSAAADLRSWQASYFAGLEWLGSDAPGDLAQPLSESIAALAAPRDAGSYRSTGFIAEGGMGLVERIWDVRLQRSLARKVLRIDTRRSSLTEKERRDILRFLDEVCVVARLQHSGILGLHDAGIDERGWPFFTMPIVHGEHFGLAIARVHRGEAGWTRPRALNILVRVCEAVAYAHEQGVLHRDLKPDNVMVGQAGETFVMDWGLAKILDRDDGDASSDPEADELQSLRDRLAADGVAGVATRDGDVVGTVPYMSPEQAAGDHDSVGPPADQYSVGAMLYQVLTGRHPYGDTGEGKKAQELLALIAGTDPTRPDQLVRDLPPQLVSICERAMARDPRQRYAGMRDMATDLSAYLEHRVVRAYRTGAAAEFRTWVRRNRLAAAALVAMLVTSAVAAVVFAELARIADDRGQAARIAQADSQRRLLATKAPGVSMDPIPTFYDDFEGRRLHRRWVVQGRADLVEQRDGALWMTATSEQNTAVRIDRHLGAIYGDFDVEVSFRLHGFDVPAAGGRVFGLSVWGLSEGLLATVRRNNEHNPDPCMRWEATYSAAASQTECLHSTYVASNDASGGLRLARRGGKITSYYQGAPGWEEIRTDPCTREPVHPALMVRDWTEDPSFTVAIDDVTVETAVRYDAAELSSLRDSFDTEFLDPRYVRGGDAGYAAAVDGRLSFDKISGRPGGATVDLDPLRWMLRGECEITVDFELDRFRQPESGETVCRLQILDLAGHHFGAVEMVATPTKTGYRGMFQSQDEFESSEDRRGRFRLTVGEAGVVMSYEADGAWRRLLHNPWFDAAGGAIFRLELASTSASADPVVHFDNLCVSSLQPR
ncbi:MAG: serine/threonine-protein kinase [Planctomycetota bacterium]